MESKKIPAGPFDTLKYEEFPFLPINLSNAITSNLNHPQESHQLKCSLQDVVVSSELLPIVFLGKDTLRATMGFSNPKYRKFNTLKEASDHYNEFLRTGEVPKPKRQNMTRHGKFEDDDSSSSQPHHPREIATSTHHPPPPCPLHCSMPMNVTLHVSPCNVFEQMLLYAIAVLTIALLLKHVLFIW